MNVPDDELPNVRAECPEDGQETNDVSVRSQVVRNSQIMIGFDELMPMTSIMPLHAKTKVSQSQKQPAVTADCEAVSCATPDPLFSTSPKGVFNPVPEAKGDFTKDNTILIDSKFNPTTDGHILKVFEGAISSLKAANASAAVKRDKWRIKGSYIHEYDVCQYEAQLLHVPTAVGLKKEPQLAVEFKLKGHGGRESFFNLVQVTAFILTTDGGGEVADKFASGAPIIDPSLDFIDDVLGSDQALSDDSDPEDDEFDFLPMNNPSGDWQSGIMLEGTDDELLNLWTVILTERNYVTLIDTLKSAAKASEILANATVMASSNAFLSLVCKELSCEQKKMDGSLVFPAISIISNVLRFDSAKAVTNLRGQKVLDDVCSMLAKHGANGKIQEVGTKVMFQLVDLGFKVNDKAKESIRGIFEGKFQQDNSCERLPSKQLVSTVG